MSVQPTIKMNPIKASLLPNSNRQKVLRFGIAAALG